jgi:hypothetical protein
MLIRIRSRPSAGLLVLLDWNERGWQVSASRLVFLWLRLPLRESMTSPNFSLFPQRLGRIQYCVRLLLTALGVVAGHYIMNSLFAHLPPNPPHWARVVLPDVNPVLWCLYILLFVIVPRFRDTGAKWFAYVALLVPGLNTLLIVCAMFVPTDYFKTPTEARSSSVSSNS